PSLSAAGRNRNALRGDHRFRNAWRKRRGTARYGNLARSRLNEARARKNRRAFTALACPAGVVIEEATNGSRGASGRTSGSEFVVVGSKCARGPAEPAYGKQQCRRLYCWRRNCRTLDCI